MLKILRTEVDFSLAESRHIVKDLFSPRPLIYWTDFLLTLSAGAFAYSRVHGGHLLQPHQGFQSTWSQAVFFFVSCLLFYRAAMFIHELSHLRDGSVRGFSIVWNLLCGIPFLTPSFVYYRHVDHHRRNHYGTERDGEYFPFESRRARLILFYLLSSLVIPPLAVLRFLVLTPLSWFSPRLRRWIHQHVSSLVVDPTYIRPLPTQNTLRIIRLQEAACFLLCLGIAVVPRIFLGRFPVPFLVHAYLTGTVIVMINSLRTLGAHRWDNPGEEMTFLEQLLDSVNYPRFSLLAELWGPVGTRFHALHHLFPSLPYHALPAAHRRLTGQLPADSPYRRTEESSLTRVLLRLWRRAQTSPHVSSMRYVAKHQSGQRREGGCQQAS